jgi:uncharacterized damage-inducible protein DinB
VTVTDLQRLYDYGYWANRKLFPVIAALTAEEFTTPVAGSWGSVRNTLVHMMSAEWGWLERCGGAPRGPTLTPEDFPTFDSVVATWTVVEGHMRAFLATLTEADVTRVVAFTLLGKQSAGELGAMLQHGATHSVHHRGQIALLLRVLGHAPGNVDLVLYDGERAARA